MSSGSYDGMDRSNSIQRSISPATGSTDSLLPNTDNCNTRHTDSVSSTSLESIESGATSTVEEAPRVSFSQAILRNGKSRFALESLISLGCLGYEIYFFLLLTGNINSIYGGTVINPVGVILHGVLVETMLRGVYIVAILFHVLGNVLKHQKSVVPGLLKKGDCFADQTKCKSHPQLIACIEKYQEKESIGYMILGTPIIGWKTVLLALIGPVGTLLVRIATR